MSYCLNPDCQNPQNPDINKFCQRCGTKLVLGDRYRALKPIGQGGFGRTFLAVDEYKPSKPRCVIKQFFPQAQGTKTAEKAAALFQQEAVRLDELGKHRQIPELLAYFTQDLRQYLVQEFIDGQNLAQELAEEGAFNETQIRQVLNDLLPVLQFVHEHQVIHRDIKPENILRRRGDNQLVLVDFGAAKFTTGTSLARTGTVIGSAGYVAPEQAVGKANFASDVYSLGVTCIHLLTLMHPFELFDISESDWVWRQYLTSPISDRLSPILDKMVQSAIKRRYQSVAEVLKDLNPQPTPAAVKPDPPPAAPIILTPTSTPETQSWKCVQTLTGHSNLFGTVRSVVFTPNSQLLASGSEDRTIKLWNLATGKQIRTLAGHSDYVRTVAISSDGQTLVSGSDDKIIKLWNLNAGQEIRTLFGHSGYVRSVAISQDSQTLASGGDDKIIRLWKLQTGEAICTLAGHSSNIQTVAISPDSKIIASGSWDNTVKLWNLSSRQEVYTLSGHSNTVRAVVFISNAHLLASGSDDKTIKIWDCSIGKEVYTIIGHTKAVTSVAISPDGETLASGSDDNTIKLWNLKTGQEVCTLYGHSHYVVSVSFSPDGQILASGSCDNTIKIWRCD